MLVMNYEQAKQYLSSSLRFGIKLGLHRMRKLMALLGQPQNDLRFLHIAGTNGKGSVSSYCASILASSGYKTAVYTSPYINRLTERLRIIDGQTGLKRLAEDESHGEIPEVDFARGMSLVRAAVDQMLSHGHEQPTEFELLTALAFLYFKEQHCDIVVLETGLGGRLDSTNIIEKPDACLITALGYDHMDRLGSSLGEIATEKAGIIKRETPVYLYDPRCLDLSQLEKEKAFQSIEDRCRDMEAPLHLVQLDQVEVREYGWTGQHFCDKKYDLRLQTKLLGVFQPLNAVLAARVCLDLGLADREAVEAGVAAAAWPARLEVMRRDPPVLIDGAHNIQSCTALRQALNRLLPGKEIIFITGMLGDKETIGMLAAVIGPEARYRIRAVICTEPDNPRALPAEQLAAQAVECLQQLHITPESGYNMKDTVIVGGRPGASVRIAADIAREQQLAVCAFGSLYLMGDIRLAYRTEIEKNKEMGM